MGPIKIKIATTQIEGASEYDAPRETPKAASEYDAPKEEVSKAASTETASTDTTGGGGSCYTYEGNDCYYTDPASGIRFLWDGVKNQWLNKETGEARDAETGQPQAGQPNYKFDGQTYYYVNRLTMEKYKWNLETKAWDNAGKVADDGEDESEEDENMTAEEMKARQYRKRKAAPWFQSQAEKKIEKDPLTGISTYTDQDGVVYELDPVKNAWFPKIDEEFMANYQINYGFTKDGVAEPTKPSEEEAKPAVCPVAEKKKKTEAEKEAAWFQEEEAKSTKVYVSNLPSSITEETFVEFMAKCGMVENDIRTKKPKVKVYKTEEGVPKGDGLCSYIKPESVQLALTILDGSELEGKIVSVTRAKFELKGEYDPKLKPKKLTKKQLDKAKKAKERMFEWVPEKLKGERSKNEKTIVIKNMFTVEELDCDPGLILDFSNNIRSQCSKFGIVAKVTLYDKHPEGVCQVFFKEASEADMAVQMLDGRMFGQKVMDVKTWDGKTKYKTEESKEDEAARLAAWEKHLLGADAEEETEHEGTEVLDQMKKEEEAGEGGAEHPDLKEKAVAEDGGTEHPEEMEKEEDEKMDT